MRTKTALVLSITGILLTGSAALAANTPTLNNSAPGTTGTANSVLLPDDSASHTPTAPGSGATAAAGTPKPTATGTGTAGDDRKASPSPALSAPAIPSVEPTDDKGGQRQTPEPGDDNGVLDTTQTLAVNGASTAEPGDDNGGRRSPQMTPTEARDDKGGVRTAPEPGDDSGHGGHGRDD